MIRKLGLFSGRKRNGKSVGLVGIVKVTQRVKEVQMMMKCQRLKEDENIC